MNGALRALARRVVSVLRRGRDEERLAQDLRALLRGDRLDAWVEVGLRRAHALGLGDARRRRVLALGASTASAGLLIACRHLGHEVLAIGLEGDARGDELLASLDLPRRTARIGAFEPLPSLPGRFDLVATICVAPDEHELGRWGPGEWESLLTDLVRHHLAPGGRILLSLGTETRTDDALLGYFRTAGGVVDGRDVVFDGADLQRGLPGLRGEPGAVPPGALHQAHVIARTAARRLVRRVVDRPRSSPFLVVSRRVVPWSRLLPAGAGQGPHRLLGSFPTPGRLEAKDALDARASEDELVFERPGEHDLRTSGGALKVLVLDASQDADAHLLELFAFFARNLVHTQADAGRLANRPDGLFGLAVGEVRPDKLLEKLFRSDQPLGLHCGHASQVLNDLVRLAGWRARLVELRDARGRGHVVSEALLPVRGRWVLLDPDYGAFCTDERDEPISVEELVRSPAGQGLRIRDVAQKHWLRHDHDPAPDPAFTWTPALSSDRRTVDPGAYRALLRAYTHEARTWEYRDRFTVELRSIRRRP